MSVRRLIARAIRGTPLYGPVRDSYQFVFNRDQWRRRKARRAFYRQFIPKGSLVFDIGANTGEYTRTFLALGARVVAVEPDPACVSILRTICPSEQLTVVQSAVGDAVGTGTLNVNRLSQLSSLADGWIAVARKTDRYNGYEWRHTITVPITTLDLLIATHGVPHFIKIDVEGYEAKVLDDLSTVPQYLSFEFLEDWIEAAISCLHKPCFGSDVEFNFIIDQPRGTFLLEHWVSAADMTAIMSNKGFLPSHCYGDIFARRE